MARKILPAFVRTGSLIKAYDGRSVEDQVEDLRQLGQDRHLFTSNSAVPRQDRLPHSLGKPPEPAPDVVARAKQVQDPRKRLAVINGHDPAAALNKHSHLNKVWVKG